MLLPLNPLSGWLLVVGVVTQEVPASVQGIENRNATVISRKNECTDDDEDDEKDLPPKAGNTILQ